MRSKSVPLKLKALYLLKTSNWLRTCADLQHNTILKCGKCLSVAVQKDTGQTCQLTERGEIHSQLSKVFMGI
jgi:hypothetical protein